MVGLLVLPDPFAEIQQSIHTSRLWARNHKMVKRRCSDAKHLGRRWENEIQINYMMEFDKSTYNVIAE